MSANATWDFLFDGATGSWAKQPAVATAGGFPFMAGVDGRYQGVLRRYPGHLRYDRTTTRAVETCREAFPFVIQSGPGSNTKCRGYLSCDTSDGKVEAVWRHDDDTADTLRTTDVQGVNHVVTHQTSITDSTAISRFWAGAFDGPRNSAVRVHQLLEFTENGETNLVAVGDFEVVGARHASGIARYREGVWEPLGFPAFNGPVYCAAVFGGELYIGGAFTKYLDKNCLRLAKWNGDTWSQVGGGIGSSAVYAMAEFSSALWVGGDFTADGDGNSSLRVASTDGSTITAKTGAAGFNNGQVNALAVFDSELWAGGTFTANGTPTAIAQPLAFLSGGTTWTYAGTAGSPPTYDVVDSLAVFSTGARLYVGWRNGTSDHGVHSLTTANSFAEELANSGATASDTVILVSSGASGAFASALNGSFDVSGAVTSAYQTSLGGAWTELATVEGRIFERSDNTLVGGGRASTALTVGSAVGVVGCTFDACYAGPFIYLYCSNGNHRVISYDGDTDELVTETLGPGKVFHSAPTVAKQTPGSGDSYANAGNYAGAYRYVDRRRNRYSALSGQGITGTAAADNDWIQFSPPTAAYDEAPAGYDRVQGFVSISSGSTEGAGGTLYRAAEGSISSSTNRFVQINTHLFTTAPLDNGNGTLRSPLADLSLPQDPTRAYDFVREEVFDVGGVAACAVYGGTTFVLERRGGFLDLRWSPTIRYEPENFPTANTYQTDIPSDLMGTCRFVTAGDFLYCFGGSSMYRIQKSGTAVGIIPLHSDYPFVHKNGFVKVGTRIYAVHEMGILQLEGKSGDAVDIPAVRRIFYDRWRGNVVPNSDPAGVASTQVGEKVVCCAYDSKMRCVYVHNRHLRETICLWLSTGKVTMLTAADAFNCVTMPDLDDKTSMRTYWMSASSSWVATPNWDTASTAVQTATGFRVYTQGALKYNLAVASQSNGTELTFADAPFTTNGTTVHPGGTFWIAVLSGADKGKIFQGAVVTASRFDISSASETNIVAGDVIAVDPVVFELLGANLWDPRSGRPMLNVRKRIDRQTVKVNRVSSPGTTADSSVVPLDSNYGQFTVGTLRSEDVEANEPLVQYTNRKFVPRQSAQVRAGLAISAESGDNWTRVVDEGTDLYPYLLCLASNYAFELTSWSVAGSIYGGDKVGS